MSMKIYGGSLYRYLLGDWLTKSDQLAQSLGYLADEKVYKEDKEREKHIKKLYIGWREDLIAALNSQIREMRKAEESKEGEHAHNSDGSRTGKTPNMPGFVRAWDDIEKKKYITFDVGWTGFGAFFKKLASEVYGTNVEEYMSREENLMEDELVERLLADENINFSMVQGATMWLPISVETTFLGLVPTGEETLISSLASLRRELSIINNILWKADQEEILSWLKIEGYKEVYIHDGKVVSEKEALSIDDVDQCYDLENLSKMVFAMFYASLIFCEEENVVLVIDW